MTTYSGDSLEAKEESTLSPITLTGRQSSKEVKRILKSRYILPPTTENQLSEWVLPELSQVIQDLKLCGGRVRNLLLQITTDRLEQESLLSQIYQQLDKVGNESLKEQWTALQRAGIMMTISLSLDGLLDKLRDGELKSIGPLEYVIDLLMPQDKNGKVDTEAREELEKLKAHINAMSDI